MHHCIVFSYKSAMMRACLTASWGSRISVCSLQCDIKHFILLLVDSLSVFWSFYDKTRTESTKWWEERATFGSFSAQQNLIANALILGEDVPHLSQVLSSLGLKWVSNRSTTFKVKQCGTRDWWYQSVCMRALLMEALRRLPLHIYNLEERHSVMDCPFSQLQFLKGDTKVAFIQKLHNRLVLN